MHLTKHTNSHEEWGDGKQIFIVLIAATIIIVPFFNFVLFYSVNLYLYLSPPLTTIVQGAINLNIGAVFAFASIILSDIAALFAVWEFVQKKYRKPKDDILLEGDEGVTK